MTNLWVVVAHRAGVRIFNYVGADTPLEAVEAIDHPQGRLQSQEFESDAPGSARVGARSGEFEQHDDPHEHVAKVFAKTIADRLEEGRNAHAYSGLLLVAEPRFLGMLNQALDPQTARLVRDTVNKDLYQVEARDLASHLGAALTLR